MKGENRFFRLETSTIVKKIINPSYSKVVIENIKNVYTSFIAQDKIVNRINLRRYCNFLAHIFLQKQHELVSNNNSFKVLLTNDYMIKGVVAGRSVYVFSCT